jgi:AcrR family transcriptional regulator
LAGLDIIRSNEQEGGMVMERLLDTAVVHFGERGFEGASTRAIAKASGTAMSSITYHFGGKEGLYLAVADHIAARIAARQAEVLKAARETANASREQAREMLLVLLESFARMLLAPESAAWSSFISREQQHPTAAFERLFEGAMKNMVETFVALVQRARPDLDEPQARATAIMLYGQALILRTGRASVCRALKVDAIDPETEALLMARLRAHTFCILSESPS